MFFQMETPSIPDNDGDFVGNWMWNESSDWKNVVFLLLEIAAGS